ncbi:Uncharacterised protein [Cedecea neteri]|uniref:DUF1281 domain-containing protein n=1 Tax=Cedecea neteri TaxID=158822 RepID=A0A2X2T665_9ENTR|nr:Uncharacterised protein [Cedecea neteri]
MRPILRRQYADWFGVVGLSDNIDAGECWERLAVLPEYAPPCDMLLVIPTRLAAEINGNGSLLSGMSTQASLYERLYGMVWPSGHNVTPRAQRGRSPDGMAGLALVSAFRRTYRGVIRRV